MIAWINMAVLIAATLLTLSFYVKSADPAALEKEIGPGTYAKCTRYRFISEIMMGIACVNYVVYVFYPLWGHLREGAPPQAAGELPFWWVIAFLLHSPFLVLYSFVWVPVFIIMCLAEERDLIIRDGDAFEAYRRRTGFLIPKRG